MAWASTIPNAGIELTPNSSHLAEASRGQKLIRHALAPIFLDTDLG